MAIVKRQSGSWKAVIEVLGLKGIQIDHISDLPKMLEVQKNNYTEAIKIFEKEQGELQESFNHAVEKLFKDDELLTEAIHKKFDQKVKTVDGELEVIYQQERALGAKDFWFKLFHLETKAALWRARGRLKSKRQKLFSEKEKELKAQKKIYNDKKQSIIRKNAQYQFEIKQRVSKSQERVTVIEETLKSGVYYGALSELKMIDLLSKLPDTYYVINDVTLRLNRSVFFDGAWLSSAQIDHLVIGPAGIFVVEVKNWSKKFTSDGDFFDPYQQVKRHNYVCYTLLSKIVRTTVRSIVACAGYLPDKPDSSYAKVLSLEQVNGYILWFKDVKHDDAAIQRIAQFIEKEIEYAK